MPLVILRVLAVLALIVLLWNPSSARLLPAGDQPIVLLDASLSMSGTPWRAALDTARAFGRRRAVIWRFGTNVTAFDTAPPGSGASRLAPALEAAAGRAGEVVVVTDGNLEDAPTIPPDLLARPRIIVTPRPMFADAYIAGVEGPRHVTRTDTIRLRVSYGVVGPRDARSGMRDAGCVWTVDATENPSTIAAQILARWSAMTHPASRIPHPD